MPLQQSHVHTKLDDFMYMLRDMAGIMIGTSTSDSNACNTKFIYYIDIMPGHQPILHKNEC